jgi:glycosyltransferase involved in cell wall biosynthesis
MRILFLSPRQCWPANSGAKLREYYFARALGRGSELTHIHFTDPNATPLSAADLPFCRDVIAVPKPPAYNPAKVIAGVLGRYPLPVVNYTSPEMAQAISQAIRGRSFDLVHLDSIHMVGYLEGIAREFQTKPRVVYNWHNIESEAMRRYSETVDSTARRMYAAWTARKLASLEKEILRDGFGHIVCSERERTELLTITPKARVVSVDNGVDTAYYAGAGDGGTPRHLVFVGSMSYYPNVEAAVSFTRDIWPALRERLPKDAQLIFVGANPAPEVLALRSVEGVQVTGTVDDTRVYYRDALAAIVPLKTGGGTRLKILEAMAAGVPVISTPLGAEGLAVKSGTDLVIAEAGDREAWVRGILGLAESAERRTALIAAGLNLVTSRYDWDSLGSELCEIYERWLKTQE